MAENNTAEMKSAAPKAAAKAKPKKAAIKKTAAPKTYPAKKTIAKKTVKKVVAKPAKAEKVQPEKTLKVTLVKSVIGTKSSHRATVLGLGLRRIRHSVELEDTPAVRGMINKVNYLVKVEA